MPSRSPCPLPFNGPLPAAETVSVCLALAFIIINMLLSCDNLTVASAEACMIVGSMLYGSRPVLPKVLPRPALCLVQLPAVASYISMHPSPNDFVLVRMSS